MSDRRRGMNGLLIPLLVPVVAMAIAGCESGGRQADHRSSTSTVASVTTATTRLPSIETLRGYVDESWTATGPDAGGYSYIADLSTPPSLYRTSWMLQLCRQLGLAPQGLDPDRTADWLRSYVTSPRSREGLPVLETLELATQALRALGRPASADPVARALERLRVDGRYRWDNGQQPTWAASAVAVTVLHNAALPVPPRVTAVLFNALTDSLRPGMSMQQFADESGPMWQVADVALSSGERAPYRARLEVVLAEMAAQLRAMPSLEGPGLALVRVVQDVGEANGIRVSVPHLALGGLLRADGLLAPNASAPSDPQTTWLAVGFGWSPSARTETTVIAGAGPLGWPASSRPLPETTFYGLQIAIATHADDHRKQAGELVASWLNQLDASDKLVADGWRTDYFILATALELGLRLPDELVAKARLSISSPASTDSAPMAVHLASLLHLLIPQWAIDALRRQPPTAQRLLAMELSIGFSQTDVRKDLEELRGADGAFRDSDLGAVPDIRASAIGRRGLGLAPAADLAEPFADPDGYWLGPPARSVGNVVDLQTIYLGLYLAGGVSSGVGVI